MRLVFAVFVEPAQAVQCGVLSRRLRAIRAIIKRRLRPRPAGVFPFRLRRQAKTQGGRARAQSFAEFDALVPGDRLDRTRCAFEMTRVFTQHGLPLRLRAGRVRQPIALGDRDLMGRPFVVLSA